MDKRLFFITAFITLIIVGIVGTVMSDLFSSSPPSGEKRITLSKEWRKDVRFAERNYVKFFRKSSSLQFRGGHIEGEVITHIDIGKIKGLSPKATLIKV